MTWRWNRWKASTAEIVEGPTDEDGFIKFCQDADAIYAKGIRITKKIIDGLPARSVAASSWAASAWTASM